MKSVVISKRFAQINNCKLKQRIIRVTMMFAWRLERPEKKISQESKQLLLPQCAVGSIDRNGFLWSEAKGFVCVWNRSWGE